VRIERDERDGERRERKVREFYRGEKERGKTNVKKNERERERRYRGRGERERKKERERERERERGERESLVDLKTKEMIDQNLLR